MFKSIAFSWRLSRLEREKAKLLLKQKKEIALLWSNHKDLQLLEGLHQEHYFEFTELESERVHLMTARLMAAASRMMVPTPGEDAWEECQVTGYRLLTREGIQELRRAVRAEEAARRDAALSWLGAGTGLVGALTGLVAVLMMGK